jgi:hypothetical protein
MGRKRKGEGNGSGANLGFEEQLWAAADKMRGHLDPAEYKHVALGLIFLKYISDAFEDRQGQLSLWTEDPTSEYYIREAAERYLVLEDIGTSTGRRTSSGCRPRRAGPISRPTPSGQRSGRCSTTPWWPSSGRTHR